VRKLVLIITRLDPGGAIGTKESVRLSARALEHV
jgi:hypothetical protein